MKCYYCGEEVELEKMKDGRKIGYKCRNHLVPIMLDEKRLIKS